MTFGGSARMPKTLYVDYVDNPSSNNKWHLCAILKAPAPKK